MLVTCGSRTELAVQGHEIKAACKRQTMLVWYMMHFEGSHCLLNIYINKSCSAEARAGAQDIDNFEETDKGQYNY